MNSATQLVLFFVCISVANAPAWAADNEKPRRPNIVLIMADDMGYECVAANGSLDYSTPRLDQLATEGLRFTHCYSQPLCTPSRVKLMTGMSNKRNYLKFGILRRQETTFANLLKAAGYRTCIAGKWQLGKGPNLPQHFGFEESLLWQHTRGRVDEEGHDTRYVNPRLELNGEEIDYLGGEFAPDLFVDFIGNFIRQHRGEPFLVYYPMALVHCPFSPTPDARDWDPTSRGSATYKGNPAHFGSMVEYTDTTVGRIIDILEANDVRENTLIMFVGDNGTDKPIVTKTKDGVVAGAKGTMTDAGTRVPCIVSWPAAIKQPQVMDDLIDFSDFLPTICELASVALPTDLNIDGRSFSPQLVGDPSTPRDSIYIWYSRNGKPEQAQAFARNQRFKLYENGEFFDVANDYLEQRPLDSAALSDQARTIRQRLQAHIDQFSGVVPPQSQRN